MKKFIFILLVLIFTNGFASDLAKEKRWAEQIVDSLLDGEGVTLNDGANDFLGIFTKAENPKANVIVIHGIGGHPDWPQVINPLRVSLAENGFNTLSIQMPVLANEAKSEDYDALMPEVGPRIKAAIKHLNKCCKLKTHIVAHSLGARMSTVYLNDNPAGIDKFVAIGMNQKGKIDKISIPVLEIYGENDLEGVLASIPERKLKLNSASSQIMIKGADHFMEGHEDELLSHLSSWLD